jgi:hypothetical protein
MPILADLDLRTTDSQSTSRANQVQETIIPNGYPVVSNHGQNADSINAGGLITEDTDDLAKVKKNQFLEIVSSPCPVYVQFGRNQQTYNGWYMLNGGQASVSPAVCGSYPFTFSARKLFGNLGTYYSAAHLENDWNLITPVEAVGLPGGVSYGGAGFRTFSSETGDTSIIVSETGEKGFYVFKQPDFESPGFYEGQCVVLDGTSRVYGARHKFTGNASINNGLVGLDYIKNERRFELKFWDGVWITLARNIKLYVDAVNIALPQDLIIETVNKNMVVFTSIFAVPTGQTPGYAAARFTLRKGAFYFKIELSTAGGMEVKSHSALETKSGLTITELYNQANSNGGGHTTGVALHDLSNYGGARLSNGYTIGFLYTEQVGPLSYPPGSSVNTETVWGRSVLPNQSKTFGIFATDDTPPPPPVPGSKGLLSGKAFLGNSDFTSILV